MTIPHLRPAPRPRPDGMAKRCRKWSFLRDWPLADSLVTAPRPCADIAACFEKPAGSTSRVTTSTAACSAVVSPEGARRACAMDATNDARRIGRAARSRVTDTSALLLTTRACGVAQGNPQNLTKNVDGNTWNHRLRLLQPKPPPGIDQQSTGESGADREGGDKRRSIRVSLASSRISWASRH